MTFFFPPWLSYKNIWAGIGGCHFAFLSNTDTQPQTMTYQKSDYREEFTPISSQRWDSNLVSLGIWAMNLDHWVMQLNLNTSQCLLLYVSLWRWNAQGQLFRAHCKNILTNSIELGGSLQILYLKKPTQNYYFSRSVKNHMKGNEDKCHVHFP